jgi:hypothetical protein
MQHNTSMGRRSIFATAIFYDGSVRTGAMGVRRHFGVLPAVAILFLLPIVAARAQQPSQDDATQQQPAPGQPQQENGAQEPMPQQQETPQEQPSQPQATPEQTPKQPAAQAPAKYSLTDSVSIELPQEWRKLDSDQIPPPAELASYAPPFHLSGLVMLLNSDEGAMLQLATSDNPLVGRDPYWLDTQMHSPSGSGMSLPDFLFYFFLPPSTHCMEKVLNNLENATRVPPTDDSFGVAGFLYLSVCGDAAGLLRRAGELGNHLPARCDHGIARAWRVQRFLHRADGRGGFRRPDVFCL